jgi:hypothetical protein
MASDDANILAGFVPEDEFATANQIHARTVKRYRDQPDGLPYLIWGNRVYIPTEAAREWLLKRVRRPNPTKRWGVATCTRARMSVR